MDNAYLDALTSLAPELTLIAVALAVLVVDLVRKGRDSNVIGWITLGGLFVTGFLLYGQWGGEPELVLALVTVDNFGTFFKLFTVAALAVVTVFVMNDVRERKHGIGEYYFLLLGAAIGIFFMVSTNNLLLMILGLELLSLASYSLAGFHKGDKASAEASMKYVIFGGLSSGIMIYGISLLYGVTGTLNIDEMGLVDGALASQVAASPVPLGVAVLLILAGFAYKTSVAPFHFWTPDVYQGAPTPVTTFLAVASKAGGFGALLRFVGALFLHDGIESTIAQYADKIGLLLAILAAITMTLGNLAALRQSSLKRMLAYSSIAHAGYVLIGLACMSEAGLSAAMLYLGAYYFMNLGAFGFLLYFEGVNGDDSIDSLKGLGPRTIVISCAMVACLVSLTGLPPTIGFYGKYMLFVKALDSDLGWLAVLLGVNSAISLYYYLRVAKALFLAAPSDRPLTPALSQPVLVGFVTGLSVLTVLFGLFPDGLAQLALQSVDILR